MSDDGEPDDPQLQVLRAVWLTMPDQEPPQRGLAQLIAAAREQAEAMAKPSLWQRIVSLLRRPPVLALAAVLVLIGGAVVIGERRDRLDAVRPAATVETPREAERTSPARDDTLSALAAPVSSGAAGITPAPDHTAVAAPVPDHTAVAAPVSEPTPGEPPVGRPPRTTAAGTNPPPARTVRWGPAASTSPPRTGTEGRTGADMLANGPPGAGEALEAPRATPPRVEAFEQDPATEPRVQPRAEAALQSESPGAHAVSSEQVVGQAKVRGEQLVGQAKAAAARGDCMRARELMKRVGAAEPALHRNAIVGDAALKKCVE